MVNIYSSGLSDAEDPKLDKHAPPDGGYGWICVGCCFTISYFTWGSVNAYGLYLSYYLRSNSFPDAIPLDFAFVGGANFAGALIVAPLVNLGTRKYGTKPPMFFGVFAITIGFITAAFAKTAWQLFLTQGLLVGIGIGFVYLPSIAILSQWFSTRRSLANGVQSSGSGVGGIMFSLATEAMIDNLSLQWSLWITAIISFVMLSLAVALIRDRNDIIQPSQEPFDYKLLKRCDVWLLLGWSMLIMLGYVGLLFSMSDFSISIGLSQSQATNVVVLLNLGTALGRPFIGVLSDRFGRFKVAALLTLSCGLACFAIWIPANSFGVTILFALLSGGLLGIFWVVIGPLCVEVAGLKNLPSLLSLSWVAVVLPTFFSEAISLKLRRPGTSHEYLYTQIFAGLCYVFASFFLVGLHLLHVRRCRNKQMVIEEAQEPEPRFRRPTLVTAEKPLPPAPKIEKRAPEIPRIQRPSPIYMDFRQFSFHRVQQATDVSV